MRSNHLYLLPSYFKTLRLSTAWNRIPASPSEVWNLTNWANQSAVPPNHVCLLVFLFGSVLFLCVTFVCPLFPSSIQREHESLNNHRFSIKWFHLFLPTLPKQFHVFSLRGKHLYRQMQIVLLTTCSFFSIFSPVITNLNMMARSTTGLLSWTGFRECFWSLMTSR